MKHYFVIDEISSLDFDIIINSSNSIDCSNSDVEFVSIPGRNGDIVISKNRFENFELKYSCIIKSISRDEAKRKLFSIKEWLNASSNYRKIRDSYNEDGYRLVCFNNVLEFELEGNIYKFEISFNSKPFIYLYSGEAKIKTTNNKVYLTNPTKYTAYPLINVIDADGDDRIITVTNESTNETKTINVNNFETGCNLFLDCETENAYSGLKNANDKVTGLSNIIIGANERFSFKSNNSSTNLIIQPRWVRL